MLYLVGGPARSGKTTLTHHLMRNKGVPFFPIDYLRTSLIRGAPSLELSHEGSQEERHGAIKDILAGLVDNIVNDEPLYCLEGDVLTPQFCYDMECLYPEKIKACLLGYPHISVEEKLCNIKNYPAEVNNWILKEAHAQQKNIISQAIEYSNYVEKTCEELGIQFFDTSCNFEDSIKHALEWLVSE